MRRFRVAFVCSLVLWATVGVPGQVRATQPFPTPLEARVEIAQRVEPGQTLVRSIELPWRANLAGVSFTSSRGAAGVTVRIRVPGQDWLDLRIEPDEGPDPAEARAARARVARGSVFTDVQWLGHADRAEVRVSAGSAALGEVRLHVINTVGDAHRAGLLRRALRALVGVFTRVAGPVAEADPGRPPIISRAGWGADESWRTEGPGLADELRMAFVHHTVNSNSYSKDESAALVRGIYRYHTKTRGYADIAYNFLVDRYGQIFEGRWGGITEPVIGAHVLGFNTRSVGTALIGTFTDVAPPAAMQTALKKLLAWKLDVHHVPPLGTVTMTSNGSDKYPKGETVSFHRISGHRDAQFTACPGYETYRRLPAIRDGVAGIGNPKIYLPALDAGTLRPDGDASYETVTATATFSRPVSWSLSFIDRAGTLRRLVRGSGTSLRYTWGGISRGALVPTGVYRWRIEASDSTGHPASPAEGSLIVVTGHPSGVVLSDASERYVVEGSLARPVSTLAYAAKYGTLPPVVTGPGERDRYEAGIALGLRRGTLLVASSGTRYVFSAGVLRRFVDIETFTALDYDERDLLKASVSFLSSLPPGPPVDDTAVHPDGTVVKDFTLGLKWVIENGQRRPITTLARESRYRAREVVHATQGDLALPLGSAYSVRPGTLIAPPDGGTPWIVTGGAKRPFATTALFAKMGFTDQMLLAASQADLDAVPSGSVYG